MPTWHLRARLVQGIPVDADHNDDQSRSEQAKPMSAQLRHDNISTTQSFNEGIERGVAGQQLNGAWKGRPVVIKRKTLLIERNYEPSGYAWGWSPSYPSPLIAEADAHRKPSPMSYHQMSIAFYNLYQKGTERVKRSGGRFTF